MNEERSAPVVFGAREAAQELARDDTMHQAFVAVGQGDLTIWKGEKGNVRNRADSVLYLGAITIERPGLIVALALTTEGDANDAHGTDDHQARAARVGEVRRSRVLEPLVALAFEAAAAKVVGPYR